MVDEGKSNEKIYSYVNNNYGPDQIAVPRKGVIYRISYGFPYVLMGFILVLAMGFAWKWQEDSEYETMDDEKIDRDDSKKVDKLLQDHDDPLKSD